jgi:hypothetical protein
MESSTSAFDARQDDDDVRVVVVVPLRRQVQEKTKTHTHTHKARRRHRRRQHVHRETRQGIRSRYFILSFHFCLSLKIETLNS